MRSSTERAKTLEDLSGIFLFVEIDRQEGIVLVQVEGGRLTGAKKMADVFHLHEWHRRLLELDARPGDREIDEPSQGSDLAEKQRCCSTYLHNATPSRSPSSKSFDGNFSPRTSSTQVLISFAAPGVYLSRRILRRSLSSDDTDAIFAHGNKSSAELQTPSRTIGRVSATRFVVVALRLLRAGTRGTAGMQMVVTGAEMCRLFVVWLVWIADEDETDRVTKFSAMLSRLVFWASLVVNAKTAYEMTIYAPGFPQPYDVCGGT